MAVPLAAMLEKAVEASAKEMVKGELSKSELKDAGKKINDFQESERPKESEDLPYDNDTAEISDDDMERPSYDDELPEDSEDRPQPGDLHEPYKSYMENGEYDSVEEMCNDLGLNEYDVYYTEDEFEDLDDYSDDPDVSEEDIDQPKDDINLESVEEENPEDDIEKVLQEYFDDLKSKSECPDTIPDKPFESSDLKKRSPEENAEKRDEFDEKRAQLKKEWEEINGRPWPKYDHDVYSANGNLIRKAGSDYDAHHIQPLGMGGENVASNITPLNAEVHYDKQGVHSPGSPYSKLNDMLGGID